MGLKSVMIGIKVTEEFNERLKRVSKFNRRTISDYIRTELEKLIEEFEEQEYTKNVSSK